MQYNNFVDSFLDVPRLVVLPNLQPDSRVILTEEDLQVPLDTNICDVATKMVGDEANPNQVIGTISQNKPGDFKNNCKKYLYFKDGDAASPLMRCRFRAKNKCGKKGKSGFLTKAAGDCLDCTDVTWKLWELDLKILGGGIGSKGTFTVTIKNKKLSFMLHINGGILPDGQYPVYIWNKLGGYKIDQTVANVLDIIKVKSGTRDTTLFQNALSYDNNFFKLDLKLEDISNHSERELVNTQLKLFKIAISAGLYKYLMCFDKSPQPWSKKNVNGNGGRSLENKIGHKVQYIKDAMVMVVENNDNQLDDEEVIKAQFTASSQSPPGSPRSVADPNVITIIHDSENHTQLRDELIKEMHKAEEEGRPAKPVNVTGGKRKTRKHKKRYKKKKTRKRKKKKTRKHKKKKKGGMKKRVKTNVHRKKIYPKIASHQSVGLRHKNGKRYAVLLGQTNEPIVNRTTNKVILYDYKTAINKHRLKKLSSYSPQFNPQGGKEKTQKNKSRRRRTSKRKKRKH